MCFERVGMGSFDICAPPSCHQATPRRGWGCVTNSLPAPRLVDVVVPVGKYHWKVVSALLGDLQQELDGSSILASVTIVGGPGVTAFVSDIVNVRQVAVVELDTEATPSTARNLGAQRPLGESAQWKLFVDADVRLSPSFFRSLPIVVSDKGPSETLAICPKYSDLVNPASTLQLLEAREDSRVLESYRDGSWVRTLRGSCMLVRTDVFECLNGFDDTLCAAEDRDLAARICAIDRRAIKYSGDLEVLHLPPARIGNILRRKRWHAIGNAQFALKNGNTGYLPMPVKVAALIRRAAHAELGPKEAAYLLCIGAYYLGMFQWAIVRMRMSEAYIDPRPGVVTSAIFWALDQLPSCHGRRSVGGRFMNGE